MTSYLLHVLLASACFKATGATYTLARDYTGANFYTGFQFFTEPDPTDGLVKFVSEHVANATSLAGIIDGDFASNAVYLSVDSRTIAPQGRRAVRVSSSQTFHHALVIADIAHMPGGICGTWPAFWMVGQNWPVDGEIDIIEGVNGATANTMTLHTNAGVVVNNGSDFDGHLQTANCDVNAPDQPQNAGCSIMDDSALTFGDEFNAHGGGVYATEWTSDFIKIWFFSRGSVPADIAVGRPSPSAAWGPPRATFQGNFNMDDHFKDLSIVFDTTFCGQWAGQVWSTSTCAALAPSCEEYVANQPQAFAQAYWAINSLQVFQDTGATANQSYSLNGSTQLARRRSGGSVLPTH